MLIDTRCRRVLVKSSRGLFANEVLHKKCIYGNVKNYKTKWAEIKIGMQTFQWKLGMLPSLIAKSL